MEDRGVEELKSQIEWMEEDLRILKNRLQANIKPKLYKHYRNGKTYEIVDYCMIQENNEWVDAIIYKRHTYDKKFCRSEEEFREKFKLEE